MAAPQKSPLVELCEIRDELAARLSVVSEAIALLINPSKEAALLNAKLTLESERRKRAQEQGDKPPKPKKK